MSLTHLKLIDVLEVLLPNGRPTLLQDVLTLLIRHLHPGMDQEALDKVLASRVRSKPAVCESLLPGNASVLMTGLDVQKSAELLREVEDIQRKQASRAKQSATSKKRNKAVPLKKEYGITTEELREFLPQHFAGCSILVESNWHHRVRGFYPRQVPPYSMSLSFGDIRSTKVAAMESSSGSGSSTLPTLALSLGPNVLGASNSKFERLLSLELENLLLGRQF
eukprot:5027174-Amphidinium_carterae.1